MPVERIRKHTKKLHECVKNVFFFPNAFIDVIPFFSYLNTPPPPPLLPGTHLFVCVVRREKRKRDNGRYYEKKRTPKNRAPRSHVCVVQSHLLCSFDALRVYEVRTACVLSIAISRKRQAWTKSESRTWTREKITAGKKTRKSNIPGTLRSEKANGWQGGWCVTTRRPNATQQLPSFVPRSRAGCNSIHSSKYYRPIPLQVTNTAHFFFSFLFF